MREPSLQGRIYGVPNKVFPQLRKPPRTDARAKPTGMYLRRLEQGVPAAT
ncbi:hypothetical protein B0I24_103269 [Aliidiomarina maris]|uniref:Uncharacterized protein n=1 Tax=Aliidiomarina maris TaxID=531312 RepID=A0A327X0P6_9GAMM|nr:hypothetical protein B0I24_103269 [Aliidiomarina maris]